jgi:hypothetical protein
MASSGENTSQTVTLDKTNCIKFLRTFAEKGQTAGHYPLQLSHLIIQAFAKIEQIDKDSKDSEYSKVTPIDDESSDEMTELKAFQIILEAVVRSQSLGNAYSLVDASNLFLIVMYMNENVLKKLEAESSAAGTPKSKAPKGKDATNSKK